MKKEMKATVGPPPPNVDGRVRLEVHPLGLLPGDLDQFLIDFAEVLAVVLRIVLLLALGGRLGHGHHHARRAFRGGRVAELSSGGDEQVGNTVIFAQNGNVGDDIHRRDVSGEDDDATGDCDNFVGGGNGGFPKGLDHLLHTSLQALVDGGCIEELANDNTKPMAHSRARSNRGASLSNSPKQSG